MEESGERVGDGLEKEDMGVDEVELEEDEPESEREGRICPDPEVEEVNGINEGDAR